MINSITGKAQRIRDKYCYNQGSDVFKEHHDMVRCYYDSNGMVREDVIHETILNRLHALDEAAEVIDRYLYLYEVDIDFDEKTGRTDAKMKNDVSIMWMFTVLTFRCWDDMKKYCDSRNELLGLQSTN